MTGEISRDRKKFAVVFQAPNDFVSAMYERGYYFVCSSKLTLVRVKRSRDPTISQTIETRDENEIYVLRDFGSGRQVRFPNHSTVPRVRV